MTRSIEIERAATVSGLADTLLLAQIEESIARYLAQLDSANRQEPSEAIATKTTRLREKIGRLRQEMVGLRPLTG